MIDNAAIGADEQVAYLRDVKGVSFELVDEIRARSFLEDEDYFFKVKAFAKNYDKRLAEGDGKGRYIGLDFGHLVELSKLDKTIRNLALDLALDIEHSLKTRVNKGAMSSRCDRYALTEAYLDIVRANVTADQVRNFDVRVAAEAVAALGDIAVELQRAQGAEQIVEKANEAASCIARITLGRSPDYILESFSAMKSSPYSGRLIAKYGSDRLPYWALLELLSLGPAIALYKSCFRADGLIADSDEREALKSTNNLLRHVLVLRNSAAHGDCLLHELNRRSGTSSMGKVRERLLSYGADKDIVGQVKSVRVAMDLAAILMCYDIMVPDGGMKLEAGDAIRRAAERTVENAAWFSGNYAVSSFMAFVSEVFPIFADRFDSVAC